MTDICWIINGRVECGPKENKPNECPIIEACPGHNYEFDGEQWVKRPNSHAEQRYRDYPQMGDQLDAILKYLCTQPNLPSDLVNIIEQWQQVKLRYPKT